MIATPSLGPKHSAVRPKSGGSLGAIVRVIRQIIGVPDYERYVTHLRAAHPECEPMPRDAFMRERLEARYNRPGSKCC